VIANDQQLAIVSRQLRELEAWRDQVLERTTLRPFQKRITVMGIEEMIARLQEQIQEYESARSGALPPVLTAEVQDDSFAEVATALVRLRVAQGLRQEDLANALGKQQPSIARWEAEDYDGYTLKELNRLARALGRQLRISFVAPSRAETADQTST
jgi:ribosome-binding protein aMBF1 (putative translation factor)